MIRAIWDKKGHAHCGEDSVEPASFPSEKGLTQEVFFSSLQTKTGRNSVLVDSSNKSTNGVFVLLLTHL